MLIHGTMLLKSTKKKMSSYQTIARRYRPQCFKDIMGQDAVVQTLKNAIRLDRVGHAYLFSGSQGTGKTTLARLLAKALNCPNRSKTQEPCNECPSCKEITQSNSLDVLEIDGASHRGIDSIRDIKETVGYAAPSGGYKIYIIDEVHMLTKEAFNALLKTLEEPPSKVKFFFATTEAHKVPPTIISRCQRFALKRMTPPLICAKLQNICDDLSLTASTEALELIAKFAQGGMRDAESLLDQILSFHGQEIDPSSVNAVLGRANLDLFFELDQALLSQNFQIATQIAHEIFTSGKDPLQFTEDLAHHYHTHLTINIHNQVPAHLYLPSSQKKRYLENRLPLSQTQTLQLLDHLLDTQWLKTCPSLQMGLEMLLSRMIRTKNHLPLEELAQKLLTLEKYFQNNPPQNKNVEPPPQSVTPQAPPTQKSPSSTQPSPKQEEKKAPPPEQLKTKVSQNEQSRYDTAIRFAAVEFDGQVIK